MTFGNGTRSWRIIQKSQKCIFEWSKEPKKMFLAIFWSLVSWIDLILHIVIVINVLQHLETLPNHATSFKNKRNLFLDDPTNLKWGFSAIFLSLVHPVNLILHILIKLNDFNNLAMILLMLDPSKTTKNEFSNDP